MKTLTRLFISVSIYLILSSCQKNSITSTPVVTPKPDTTSLDTGTYHLTDIDERAGDSSIIAYTGFEYDASDRITRGVEYNNSGTTFTVTYTGNQGLLIENIPEIGIPGMIITDTVRFTLNANNTPIRKIHSNYMWDDGSFTSTPSVHFINDTTDYVYDAAGLLITESIITRDYTAGLPSKGDTINNYYGQVFNYTNVDGNVTGKNAVWTLNGNTITKSTTYDYTHAYPNKGYFTNPVILKNSNMFYDWPINVSYKNIPEHFVTTTTTTDAGGNVIGSTVSNNGMTFTYDANGNLATMTDLDPGFPAGTKWYFRYSK
jgi:YD repeat-containing protein